MNDALHENVPEFLIDNTPATVEEMLEQRGQRYGLFSTHAQLTQDIKEIMRAASKWEQLSPDKKEALDMIAHKIGRILNGDPNYHDSWFDLIGYAKLVSDTLPHE